MKKLIGDVNKLFVFKSLLTTPSNVLPLHLKQAFLPIIWIFTEGEGDRIESRLPFKIFYFKGWSKIQVKTRINDYQHIHIWFKFKSFRLQWKYYCAGTLEENLSNFHQKSQRWHNDLNFENYDHIQKPQDQWARSRSYNFRKLNFQSCQLIRELIIHARYFKI